MSTEIDITKPPFVLIEGVFNARSVGGYPLASNPHLHVKPNIFYRSGELSSITDSGIKTLRDELGIRQIFDVRSNGEVLGYKARELNDVEGVGFERVAVKMVPEPRFQPTDLGER